MSSINLDQKKFRLLENSDHGAVSESTTFHYYEQEDIVSANYSGGGVVDGHILATWRSSEVLEMRYHCIMNDHSLKAGKALATVRVNNNGFIELHLDWQWLGDSPENGKSIYIEVLE